MVFLTGLTGNVPTLSPSSSTSAASSSTTKSKPKSTSTHTVDPSTPSSSSKPDKEEDGGPNTAAIAAGVVSGIVGVAAILGGAWFFLKYRKRKGVVEEYRRNATISSFVGGGKGYSASQASDARLEPNMMSNRRQSNGSIADDQDFSRRILKVCLALHFLKSQSFFFLVSNLYGRSRTLTRSINLDPCAILYPKCTCTCRQLV